MGGQVGGLARARGLPVVALHVLSAADLEARFVLRHWALLPQPR
jgi:hypothetical protein